MAQQTPNPVYSDGVHFVRPASKSDTHVMRFVVGAHRCTTSKLKRHVESREAGIALVQDATARWVKEHPEDAVHVKAAIVPPASSNVGPRLEPFATTHFTCIRANPYAQVWQCTSYIGEKAAVGRPTKEGRAAKQTGFRHVKGECAVLIGDEPVRNEDGTVRIFKTWHEADEYADYLYENAPGDEVIRWRPGQAIVDRTLHFDIVFDPNYRTEARPFYVWFRDHNHHLYIDKTKPKATLDRQTVIVDPTINPQAYLDQQAARAKERELAERVPVFSEEPWMFASITGAVALADERERMLKGETVL